MTWRLLSAAVVVALFLPEFAVEGVESHQAESAEPDQKITLSISLQSPVDTENLADDGLPTKPARLRLLSLNGQLLDLSAPAGLAVVDLPADSKWKVNLVDDTFWSPGILIHIADRQDRFEIPVWPAGLLQGRLVLETHETLPQSLSVSFESAGSTGQGQKAKPVIPFTTSKCPVDSKGRFECLLPAQNLDLRLRSQGFVSHFLWSFNVIPHNRHDLGDLKLQRGASLAGLAESAAEAWSPQKAEARLTRKLIAGGADVTLERLRKATLVRRLEKNGFFHFDAIPAGTYVLEVHHPGLATAQVSPLEVFPEAETQLREPVQLYEPITLEIYLSPPRDWSGKPWKLTVYQASAHSSGFDRRPLFKGLARDGVLVLPDLSPGTMALEVVDSEGNRFHHTRDLLLEGDGTVRHDVTIEIAAISGEAFFGDEPLAEAVLFFGGRHGSQRVRMKTDGAGGFQGLLPRRGIWRVDVESHELAMSARVKIEIEADQEEIEVRFPNTEAFGTVVDPEGHPLEGAEVTLQTSSRNVNQMKTDADGRFAFRGFDVGTVALSARAISDQRTKFSSTETIQVLESIPFGPVQLVLDGSTRPVKGRLSSSRGTVAGARIQLASSTLPALPSFTRTGLDGSFETMVRADSRMLNAIILAPGFGLQGQHVPIAEDQDFVSLELQEGIGNIELVGSQTVEAGTTAVLSQAGIDLPFHILREWARGHGVHNTDPISFRLPNVLPGFYQACLHSPEKVSQAIARGETWRSALHSCTEGYVENGQTLYLEIVGRADAETGR